MHADAPRPVAVVGAGAAGLLAALAAARAGAPVVLLEGTRDGGRKILISGGGRCNILPSVARPERYVTDSSRNTLRKMLRSWPLDEQRAFFEHELEMPLELELETGKLFPSSHRARDVRDGLVRRVRESGARIWFEARVTDVAPSPPIACGSGATADGGHERRATGWTVAIQDAPPIEASAVVLATGGLSVPATGSDGRGLAIARALGHVVHATYPALTPLTADPHPHATLAGISLDVTIRAPASRHAFSTTDGFLFTHRGWSGPSVLDASHLAIRGREGLDGRRARQELEVQWDATEPDEWHELLQPGPGTVLNQVAARLPRRLAARLLEELGLTDDLALAQLRRSDRQALVDALTSYPLPWTGDEGYRKAEVTGGGVALDQVDPRSLESRRAPGLFLCGEMLDAFGPIGGHNFLWAWSTGRAAGLGAAAHATRWTQP